MKNVLIIFVALLFFTSCKRKDNTIYLSEDIKRNYSFKPGSYWIYRDSISGREDSCYIGLLRLFTANEDRKNTRFIEVLQVGFTQVPIYAASTEKISREIRFMKNLIVINEFSCFYPIAQSKQNVSWESFSGTTEWLANYKLDGTKYQNVFNINFEPTNNSNSYYRNYWLNDSIGFIKMRELGDTVNYVWELQRFKIIK